VNRILAALAIAITIVPVHARAQMVTAQDPQSVVNAMKNAGYKAELTKDPTGDPVINSGSSGSDFSIYFYNCTKNIDCRTVQFSAGYNPDKTPTAEVMNDWNINNRFARGYVTPKGTARVEMDVDLDDGGISKLLFEDNLEFYVTIMSLFEKHLAK
jgi:Putative bacterial sensory transduction regulator